jgi:hypothetical protein
MSEIVGGARRCGYPFLSSVDSVFLDCLRPLFPSRIFSSRSVLEWGKISTVVRTGPFTGQFPRRLVIADRHG